MDDNLNNNRPGSTPAGNTPEDNCAECKKNPCICRKKNRVKGSHRKGTPPKLKWI